MSPNTLAYIGHILDALTNIKADIEGHDFESFRNDRRTRQLVERNLEIISEASRRIPIELKESEPEISWRSIAGIGNVLRHDCHRSFPIVLWETCRDDLEPLQAAMERFKASVS